MRTVLRRHLYLFIFLLGGIYTQAQVTIGLGEKAAPGSLLQLKSVPNITNGDSNSDKGLLLPRVELSKKNQLFPMFGSSGNITEDYDTEKDEQDIVHTGLVVYNMTDDPEEDLCPGVHFWSGDEWLRLPRPCLCRFTTIGEDNNKYMYACADFPLIKHSEALTKCDELGDGWHLMKFTEFDQIFASDNNKGDQAFRLQSWYWTDMENTNQWQPADHCGYKALPMNVTESDSNVVMRDSPYYGSREKGGTAEYISTDDPNMDICANGIGAIGEPRVTVRCIKNISN